MQFSTILAAFIAAAPLVIGQASNDDPNGKVLYVDSPACGYYQCKVTWKHNETVKISWLNPPAGDVKIQLVPEKDDKLPTYTVVKKISAHHRKDKCNKEGQKGCGEYYWKVPSNAKAGEYTILVHSIDHGYDGYTDTVVIPKKAKSKSRRCRENDEKEA